MKDLIKEYEETLKETRKQIAAIDKELRPLQNVYRDKSRSMDVRRRAKELAAPHIHDKSIATSMEDSLKYAIEWMKTARQPGTRRGVENLAAYQREVSVDPSHFEYMECTSWEDRELSELERERLEYVLSKLSKREKEVYVMAAGKGYSQYYIAEILNISRGAVKIIYKRAKLKIESMVRVMKIG
ncbi:sigma-70 family RNA polymerase sigma factor [Bacillus infantis]|uniref:sigma-70 family RNA polymerase sigma factor n=1 Tax=Bacillus infantis TaxID=324767 RepID=UPI002FBD7C9C